MRCVYISIFPYSCKTSGGWKHISGMCIKPNIFNSIPKFVQNIYKYPIFYHANRVDPMKSKSLSLKPLSVSIFVSLDNGYSGNLNTFL